MWTVDVYDVFNDLYGVEKNNISKNYIDNSVKLDQDKRDNIIGVQSQIWSETIRNEGILGLYVHAKYYSFFTESMVSR